MHSKGNFKHELVQLLIARDTDAAQVFLDALVSEGKVTSSRGFFHEIIHKCATAKIPQGAMWVALQMTRLGLQPNVTTFNALMNVSAKAGDVEMADKLWKLMLDAGVSPTVVTYNIVLNACAQAHNGPLAETWMFQLLRNPRVKPCVVSFSTVISAFASTGNFEKAEEWFERMQEANIEADRIVFNSLINARAKAKDPVMSEYWLHAMRKKGIKPNLQTYNSLIHACAVVGELTCATQWLDKMEQDDLQPDHITCSSVIHACAKSDKALEAEYWLDRMAAMGVAVNNVCYNLVLHACARRGDHEGACRCFEKMVRIGIRPNKITFNCMIDVYAKAGAPGLCQKWLEKMVAAGCHPDDVTYLTLMRANTEDNADSDQARAWAYEVIILSYAQAGNMEGIRRWLSEMMRVDPRFAMDFQKRVTQANKMAAVEDVCDRGFAQGQMQAWTTQGRTPRPPTTSNCHASAIRRDAAFVPEQKRVHTRRQESAWLLTAVASK